MINSVMKHLNIFFPEWQGYAEDNSVQLGANIVKAHFNKLEFVEVTVPESEELLLKNDIIGFEANLRQLEASRAILEENKPETTFMIGGTCASEIGPVSYLNQRYEGNLAVLWFDAHGDLNTPQSSPSKHFHGMPLRSLLGDSDASILNAAFSRLAPAQVFILGGRDFDDAEKQYINASPVSHFTPDEMSNEKKLVEAIQNAGFDNLYVHIDLDVLEPQEFPHLLLPIDNGVGVKRFLSVLGKLKSNFNIVGSSIVEYVPKGDGDLATLDKIVDILAVK